MTKIDFKNFIIKQIEIGENLMREFESLEVIQIYCPDESAPYPSYTPIYDKDECSQLKIKLSNWENRVETVLKLNWKDIYENFTIKFKVSTGILSWDDFKNDGIIAINNNVSALRFIIDCLPYIEYNNDSIEENKTYKVFISHSQKDEDFVVALVDLLEVIGIRGDDKLFCSSTAGYWIPNSENIRNYLLKQFKDYKLIVIFIHSYNYYNSHIGLNEMGGAWVLGTTFYSFLVKGFPFEKTDAIIDNGYISIKVDEEKGAKARLNDFKEEMSKIFNLPTINANRWESKRDEFLQKVNSLPTIEQPRDDKKNGITINEYIKRKTVGDK